MSTEEQALLIAILALLFSIGIPIWQWFSNKKEKTNSKRTLLLQKIYAAKSTTFITSHDLNHFLQKHSEKMDAGQLERLEALLPRIRRDHDQLIILHDQWRDYEDGKKLNEIEKEFSAVNVIENEANNITKLIENGHRSYKIT